jgi:translocation and assembly module TamB
MARAPVQPSPDVVLAGAPAQAEEQAGMPMDVLVDVVLGEKVFVKARGLDARLKGSLRLAFTDPNDVRSTGEIRVVKGSYKTYGVDLDINRGRVFYAGGAINEPNLDVRAQRKVGDVVAGVKVTGTPDSLVVKLFSDPAMPDADILSYIVLGQPLAYSKGDTDLMMQAAGALLSTGQSSGIASQFKERLGIDVGTTKYQSGGTLGYRPIQTTPPGRAPGTTTATLPETLVTVGKYLTPRLYLSYGRSIASGINLLRLRYNLSRRFEIETQTGTVSGADIFYKINFN